MENECVTCPCFQGETTTYAVWCNSAQHAVYAVIPAWANFFEHLLRGRRDWFWLERSEKVSQGKITWAALREHWGSKCQRHKRSVWCVRGMVLWQSEGCGREGGRKSSSGQITEGLECPAKELRLHSIAFEGYSIKHSWEGESFTLVSDVTDSGGSV